MQEYRRKERRRVSRCDEWQREREREREGERERETDRKREREVRATDIVQPRLACPDLSPLLPPFTDLRRCTRLKPTDWRGR